ncbi:related to translocation protein sec62 [Ramularia collo-cygni]|uniref:Translocation protein SEC62 n=1 Tax=Ramularia collo-cygni TaxID=112498 RepID=A0A2D3VM60_9PEZI|nr:related to translocation protein sec62 [Ramularia collo-cygni]CZT23794.1 related to translocation protein sec62 [Ramularia collo-cygni]
MAESAPPEQQGAPPPAQEGPPSQDGAPQQGQAPTGPGQIQFQFPPGAPQPSPEQLRAMQQQLAAEAEKAGLTIPQYIERLKEQMAAHQQRQAQAQQQQQAQAQQSAQPGQQVPIAPGPPKPEALALAAFLQSSAANLKPRTCIFQEKRKDMFKVKRAIRALHSDAYKKARAKNPLLPEVNDRVTAENTFKLLPLSMLALRVEKIDPHEGHDHGKKKRTKGLWTVKVVPQQEAADEFHYVWIYEGAQWKNKLYAGGALLAILMVVFFPVWPYTLRIGVWYVSMAMLGLLGLFFGMAIVRLIIFLLTVFTVKPGLWLYPNLFEDVGFFDSFRPVWAWHEDEKAMKKRKKEEREAKKARRAKVGAGGKDVHGSVEAIQEAADTATTGLENKGNAVTQRSIPQRAQVEEADDD